MSILNIFLFIYFILSFNNFIEAEELIKEAQKIVQEIRNNEGEVVKNVQIINDNKNDKSKNEKKDTPHDDKMEQKNINVNYKSIMFTEKNISDINSTLPFLRLLLSKNAIKSNATLLENVKQENIEEDTTLLNSDSSLNLYLNSILYISKNYWAVWINEKKITNLDNGNGEIIITSVSPTKVSFIWRISLSRWEFVNINKQISEDKYRVENNEIKLNLTLSPNQTYVSSLDSIVEGKIKLLQDDKTDDSNRQKVQDEANQENLTKNDNLFL